MQRSELLDLYFIEARSKLIDVAAFLDRIERAEPGNAADDYRLCAFRKALGTLASPDSGLRDKAGRAEQVLLALSDPTTTPVDHAGSKAATGAWPGTI